MEAQSFIPVLQIALDNLDNGDITADQFAEYIMAEVGEVYVEHTGN